MSSKLMTNQINKSCKIKITMSKEMEMEGNYQITIFKI